MSYRFLIVARRVLRKELGQRVASTKQANLKSIAKSLEGLARAYWVAGFLGDNIRKAENWKKYLASSHSKLVAAGFPPEEATNWTSSQNKGFLDQSANAVKSKIKGVICGVGPEDVLMSVVTAISPFTGEPLRGGVPYPYILGKKSGGKTFYMGRTAKSVAEFAAQMAGEALAKKKTRECQMTFSGDIEVGDDSGSKARILDMVESDSSGYVNFFSELLFDPKVMRVLGPLVRAGIKNEVTKNLWDLVSNNPELLKPNKRGVGLRRKEVTELYNQAYNATSSEMTLGNNWQKNYPNVLEAFRSALENNAAFEKILEEGHFADVLSQERRMANKFTPPNKENLMRRTRRERLANIRKENAFKRIKEENPKEPLLIKLKSGAQMPPIVILKGYRDGIEMARKDKNVQDVYGGQKDKDGNPLEVMDWLYTMLGYWIGHAEKAAAKGEEYMLTRKQKATLNKGLGGTKGILGPYLRVALRYACMKDGMCDLTTLPSETDKFKVLANQIRSIRASIESNNRKASTRRRG